MSNFKKSADLFYIDEKRKYEPKESFKFTYEIIKPYFDNLKNPVVADIGCATGEFIYYLRTLYPQFEYYGYDISDLLIKKAKEETPEAIFSVMDITKEHQLPAERFDAVFMNGLNGAFEDPYSWIPNFLKILKDNGRAYVYGIFNPLDVDVLVRVRRSEDFQTEDFLSYWNCISQATIRRVIEEQGYNATFHKFTIDIDLPEVSENPFRSWTFKLEDGSRSIINGTQVMHNFYLLEIVRKDNTN